MTNKQICWGLGLLAVAVVGVIIYKNKSEEKKLGFTKPQTDHPKPKKCWCAGPHGMVQCPCGGA